MKRFTFFIESMKNIKASGTVTRSSRFVCRDMISHVDFENADVLVELGAGDGVITKHILKAMKPDTKLLVFEISDVFCELIREIDDDRMIVIQDSAENMSKYMKKHGYKQIHDVISAIPFVVVPEDVAENIMKEVKKYLRPKGTMVQLHYSTLSKKLYEKFFDKVTVKMTFLNIPPAFIHICN